jgi:hypothetical protein
MNCEKWLDETQEKVFDVVRVGFGGAILATTLPMGTRTIVIWSKGNFGVKIVLACSSDFYQDECDAILVPTEAGPNKSEVLKAIQSAFDKRLSR